MTGIVLDAGALIALERRQRAIARILQVNRAHGRPIVVPAGCFAQVWRGGPRQAGLATVVKHPSTSVAPLDHQAARRVGELLSHRGTSDVVDAHVAVTALVSGGTIVTGDAGDLRRLAPGVPILEI